MGSETLNYDRPTDRPTEQPKDGQTGSRGSFTSNNTYNIISISTGRTDE